MEVALVYGMDEGMAAGAIGDALSIPAATLSFHLKERSARVGIA